MPFSPYLILGAILALIGAFLAGNSHGHHAENLAWTAKEQSQIAQNIASAREAESAQTTRNAIIEKAYLNEQAKSADLANRLDAAVAHGVRLKGSCQQSVPAATTNPGGAVTAAPGDGILPQQIGRDLVDLARDAERTLAIARAGQQYAVPVK